jgi:hypothetical protein
MTPVCGIFARMRVPLALAALMNMAVGVSAVQAPADVASQVVKEALSAHVPGVGVAILEDGNLRLPIPPPRWCSTRRTRR